MSNADRPREVDFDVSDADFDPETDEILAEPPDRLGWLGRRSRIALAVVAAAAVAAVVIVHGVSTDAPTPNAARPTVAVTPGPSPVPVLPPVHVEKPVTAASTGPGACPEADDGLSLCSTSNLVPDAALAAVTRIFPGASIHSKIEEDLRDVGYGPGGLWFREIRATHGRADIVVQVRKRRPGDHARGNVKESGSRAVAVDQALTHTLTILVRVTSAAGRLPSYHLVQELARDSQLRTPVV